MLARCDIESFSFAACASDTTLLEANLLASPCVGTGSPNELIVVTNCPSAAAGMNLGIDRAAHGWVVCVHQDVFLPGGWDECLCKQLEEAERQFGPIGVAGVYGVGEVVTHGVHDERLAAERIGWVADRGRLLRDGPELPARVATLDELLLVVRRDSGLRFDSELGFHLYGADLCLQARERGLAVVAIDALCHHRSRSVGLPEAFFASARVFARKWRHKLPIATPCVAFDRDGEVHLLGNAGERPRSLAIALGRAAPFHHRSNTSSPRSSQRAQR